MIFRLLNPLSVCFLVTILCSSPFGVDAAEGVETAFVAKHGVNCERSDDEAYGGVCNPGSHSLFTEEGQDHDVVSLIQRHSNSKRNSPEQEIDEQKAAGSDSAVPVATPAEDVKREKEGFNLFQQLSINADEMGKEIAAEGHEIANEAWPWSTEWKGKAREIPEVRFVPHLDDLMDHQIPSGVIKLSHDIEFNSTNHTHHHHNHSGRHVNPYQRSQIDLTMIDHFCKDDMFLLVAGTMLLTTFDLALMLSVREHTMQSHMVILSVMVFFSIIYFLCVRIGHDWHYAEGWLTGYVVEIAMSIENMFAINLIFNAFKVPEQQVEFALTIGIYGALILRLVFIFILERLFTVGYIVDVIVGVVLLISGIMTLEDFDEHGVDDLYLTKASKWIFGSRLEADYDEHGRVFVRGQNGERRFTLLFLVIWLIIFVDIMFAVDSVGSKTGHIRNTYLNISSAVMAVFTLRASFFVIRDAAKTFHLLKYGICLVLVTMGVEMLASKWVAVGLGWICCGIAIIFVISIFASLMFPAPEEDTLQPMSAREEPDQDKPPKKPLSK